MWSASVGVTFHPRADVAGVLKAALDLLSGLNDEDAILVETFYCTLERRDDIGVDNKADGRRVESAHGPHVGSALNWRATNQNAARVRATVVRASDNSTLCSKVRALIYCVLFLLAFYVCFFINSSYSSFSLKRQLFRTKMHR